MTDRIVLAYSGSVASSAAIAWLLERYGASVVTVTVDVGQSDDLEELRSRALACGAIRAHVVDARETFVRDCAIPALRDLAPDRRAPIERLADPLIARTLLDVAAIEGSDAVAHASAQAWLDACLTAAAPARRIIAPAREWPMDAQALLAYTRSRGLPGGDIHAQRHSLLRDTINPARVTAVDAQVEIAFAGGVPVAINGVEMTPAEVVDSLSLIAGQHGIGYADGVAAPAAVVLRAAYAAADGPDASVRLTLRPGTVDVAAVTPGTPTELLRS